MMRIRLLSAPLAALRTCLSLLAVLLAACTPTATSTNSPAAATPEPAIQPFASEATALPIATSRGTKLEATDPKTVSMASGGLQFVEFFEFW